MCPLQTTKTLLYPLTLYPKAGLRTLTSVMMPGSMTATNIVGKMQVTKGKVSLTGSLCAISSARNIRWTRISSA